MLAIKIWNYLRGYVIIEVEGLTLERLLNLATFHNIYLWDIKRSSNIVLEMKLSIKGFKEMKKIVKKVGCIIEIKEKKGFPFIIYKIKQRKMLALGFMMFLLAIFFLTSTIWKIEIIGAIQTPSEEIISLLKENNIRIGKLKYNIDNESIRSILINQYDYISFVSANVKGTKLAIEIKEQDIPPEKVNKDYPCNVVAKKKGVIVKVIPKNGKSVVKSGTIVEEGQLLITGILKSEYTEKESYVHSEGEVLAVTRYTSTVNEPIVKKEERYTGKTYNQRGIEIRDKGIKFIKGDVPFTNFKENIVERQLINLDKIGIEFPIKMINYEYKEVELKEIKQNIDFLKKATQLKATKKLNNKLPKNSEVQSKNTIHKLDKDTLTTTVTIEVIEDIGKKQIIENQIKNNQIEDNKEG